MELEQRYAIRYLLRKNFSSLDIVSEIQETYKDEAYSQTTIYFWISEIKKGRTDLSNLPSTGRPVDEQIDYLILRELEINPFASARMIARKIGIAVSTVTDHFHNSLKMKNVHLKWIPHQLNNYQKEIRVKISKEIFKCLQKAKKHNYAFILTGDECWFEYTYNYKQKWVLLDDNTNDFTRPSDIQKKTMITCFFNGNGLQIIDVKPKGVKINSSYFIDHVISKLEKLDIVYKAKRQKQMMMLHYDNAPSHNSMLVENYLTRTPFKKVPHPPYSPDLAICDFGIFGTVKTNFQGKEFLTEQELIDELQNFFKRKSKEFYISLFQEWERRLIRCIDLNGEYVE